MSLIIEIALLSGAPGSCSCMSLRIVDDLSISCWGRKVLTKVRPAGTWLFQSFPFSFGSIFMGFCYSWRVSVWHGNGFPKNDTMKMTVLEGNWEHRDDPVLCVFMFRRHFLVKIYWTKASRADNKVWNQAYWKKAKTKWRGSTQPPASSTLLQTLCSVPQQLPFPPDTQEDVRICPGPRPDGSVMGMD